MVQIFSFASDTARGSKTSSGDMEINPIERATKTPTAAITP